MTQGDYGGGFGDWLDFGGPGADSSSWPDFSMQDAGFGFGGPGFWPDFGWQGGGYGWGGAGFWPDFGWHGGANATYAFSGVPGSSDASGDTVTETVTNGDRTETITYTAETSNPGLYQITSVTEGGHTRTITPDASSPTFAFNYDSGTGATTVTETSSHSTGSRTLTYSSQGSVLALTESDFTASNPSTTLPDGGSRAYFFGANGAITVDTTWNGQSNSYAEPLNPTATFTGLTSNTGSTPNTITETFDTANAVTTLTFVGDATDGYALSNSATTYIPATGAGPALDLNPFDRVDFDFTNSTVTYINSQGSAGTPVSMTADSDKTYVDLGSAGGLSGDFVAETITHGSNVFYELFYASGGVGTEYMEVARGSGSASSLSLTGLANQIAALNAIHPLTT